MLPLCQLRKCCGPRQNGVREFPGETGENSVASCVLCRAGGGGTACSGKVEISYEWTGKGKESPSYCGRSRQHNCRLIQVQLGSLGDLSCYLHSNKKPNGAGITFAVQWAGEGLGGRGEAGKPYGRTNMQQEPMGEGAEPLFPQHSPSEMSGTGSWWDVLHWASVAPQSSALQIILCWMKPVVLGMHLEALMGGTVPDYPPADLFLELDGNDQCRECKWSAVGLHLQLVNYPFTQYVVRGHLVPVSP